MHYGDPCHLLSVRYGTLCVLVLIEHWSSLGRVDVGIVVQVEPRARCRGCLRKWDVVAQQPGRGEGLRASIDCQAAHLGGQACSDPCLLYICCHQVSTRSKRWNVEIIMDQ